MSQEPGRQRARSQIPAAMDREAAVPAEDLPSVSAPTTPETAHCACGHLVVVHDFKPATKTLPSRRGQCSHIDRDGQCPCRGPR